MSITRVPRSTLVTALFLALIAMSVAPAFAQAPPEPKMVTVTAAVDLTNTYMFRGIRQDDTKIITWPYADFGLSLFSGEGALKSAGLNVGTWNSLNSGSAGSDGPSGKAWYERDYYVTLGLGFDHGVSVGTTYTAYTSPNDMFSTVKEIAFKVGVDDSAYLGKGALKPYGLIAFELDTAPGKGQADAGLKGGRYLELGVGPGWSSNTVSVTFPIKVGLSVGDYYEGPTGDSTFGYFSTAGLVTVPIKTKAGTGSWNVHGGVEVQALGDTTKAFNNGDAQKVIGTVGVGFAY